MEDEQINIFVFILYIQLIFESDDRVVNSQYSNSNHCGQLVNNI